MSFQPAGRGGGSRCAKLQKPALLTPTDSVRTTVSETTESEPSSVNRRRTPRGGVGVVDVEEVRARPSVCVNSTP